MVKVKDTYREFKLKNGLFVALKDTSSHTVYGRLKVNHGALNEKKGEEGIAHFLEHTIMRGGSKKYSPKQSDKISGFFGSSNAYTGLEKTYFPVDMLSEDTPLFLEYVSDSVFNPTFDKLRVEEERQRVLRETSDVKSSIAFKDNREYNEAFYGKDSPQSYFILGDEKVINSASIKDLKKFHKRGYHPNNMDLVLVGSLPNNIEELIEQNFGSFKSGNCKKLNIPRNHQLNGPTIIHKYAQELLNIKSPEQSNAQLSMAFVAPLENDEDSFAVNMLVNILGGGATSRLFKSISQRKGLAYGVGASYDRDKNRGGISVGCNFQSTKSEELIDSIFEEMKILQRDLVSQDNLEALKRSSLYQIAKTFETNYGHACAIELNIDTGITPEYHIKKMSEVTPENIREVALKYFPKNRSEGNYVLLLRDPLKK